MNTVIRGECIATLKTLQDAAYHCCVTSPPYWGLRDYGVDGQMGLESSPEEYVANMVSVFREVRRVLRDDATLWLNLGDSYGTGASGQNFDPQSGSTNAGGQGPAGTFGHIRRQRVRGFHKNLIGIPWRVAFALQSDGWYLRQDIIWHKPNPMPESVRDRCTKAHEYIFLLSKSARYYFDAESIKEPIADPSRAGKIEKCFSVGDAGTVLRNDVGRTVVRPDTRNKRSVWTIPPKPYKGAHFATFPPDLVRPCVMAGCPVGGTVLDPFAGAGTTLAVAKSLGREAVGIELNPEYATLAENRTL